MNRLNNFFENRENLLSLYFTAGYPKLDDTMPILHALQDSGVDIVEIGFPFSDPLADGATIQASSTRALHNGMNLTYLFKQLSLARPAISIPLVLMGYLNPVLRYGMERFLRECSDAGIDAIIIPDLPFEHFNQHYRLLFEKHEIHNIFLVTPQTPPNRVLMLDEASTTFMYMVSSAAVTGSIQNFSLSREDYFKRVAAMKLKSPLMIGFGINDNNSFRQACNYASGAIIGSSYIRALEGGDDIKTLTKIFVNKIKLPT